MYSQSSNLRQAISQLLTDVKLVWNIETMLITKITGIILLTCSKQQLSSAVLHSLLHIGNEEIIFLDLDQNADHPKI